MHIESNQGAASKSSTADNVDIISNLAAGKYSNVGVLVSISEEGLKSNILNTEQNVTVASIFEPSDGVMVKKDSAEYLSGYKDMNKRISTVEAQNNGKPSPLGTDALEEILSSIESKEIVLSTLLEKGSGYSAGDVNISGRVELGNIRGGDFLFDQQGNIIGQKYVGVVDTLENESQMDLALVTESGKDIKIQISLSDQMNQQGAIGVSRDVNFSYSASESLNDDEITGLNGLLESLQGSFSSFHDDHSISQSEAGELKQAISDSASVFSDVDLTLKMESGNINRAINVNLGKDSPLDISSKEEGMEVAYHASSLKAERLQKHMGDNPINEDINRMIDETKDPSILYKAAIDDVKFNSVLNYGEYISSFFENNAA